MFPAVVPFPALTAQSLPPTVAHPPRIVVAVLAVLVRMPLVAEIVPVGWVKVTTAPVLLLTESTLRLNGFVDAAVKVTAEAPAPSDKLGNRWLLVVLALPVSDNEPLESVKHGTVWGVFFTDLFYAPPALHTKTT